MELNDAEICGHPHQSFSATVFGTAWTLELKYETVQASFDIVDKMKCVRNNGIARHKNYEQSVSVPK